MIRAGQLCKNCSGECRDKIVTRSLPDRVQCPECEGFGCELCGGRGDFELSVCPNKFVGEMQRMIPFFDLFENGTPPISGGALDQSAWFVSSYRQFKHEENTIAAEAFSE